MDRLVYLNGRTYLRRFQTWNPGEGYTLLIGEEGGPQSYVVWTIKPTADGGSELTITVHPYLLANLPEPFLPYRLWIVPECEPTCEAWLATWRRPAKPYRATVSDAMLGSPDPMCHRSNHVSPAGAMAWSSRTTWRTG